MLTETEEQSDEILALSEILPPGTFSTEVCAVGGHRGYIEVNIRLESPILIVQPECQDDSSPSKAFSVNHLPPVKLEFSLGPDYPALSAPLFHLSCPWITREQRDKVSDHLKQLWEENKGSVILFLWLNFLQEELVEFLELGNELDISTITVKTRCLSGSKCEGRVIDDDEHEQVEVLHDDEDDTPGPRSAKLRDSNSSVKSQDETGKSDLREKVSKDDSTETKDESLPNKSQSILRGLDLSSVKDFKPKTDPKKTGVVSQPSNSNKKIITLGCEPSSSSSKMSSESESRSSSKKMSSSDPHHRTSNNKIVSGPESKHSSKKTMTGTGMRRGKVKFFNVKELTGVVCCGGEDVVVRHENIKNNNPNKLEASLADGEKVELNTRACDWSFEGVRYRWEAVDVTGEGGGEVIGNKRVDNVELLAEGVKGTVTQWNPRFGEGRLEGGGWDVYVYFTCLHFTPQTLNPGEEVVFNVVKSRRWGVLANLVRREEQDRKDHHGGKAGRRRKTSNEEIEAEMMRMEKERSKEVEEVAGEHSRLGRVKKERSKEVGEVAGEHSMLGRVKKLRKDFGFIVGDDKLEYKVSGKDMTGLHVGARVRFKIEESVPGRKLAKGISGFVVKVTVIDELAECNSADVSLVEPVQDSDGDVDPPFQPQIVNVSNSEIFKNTAAAAAPSREPSDRPTSSKAATVALEPDEDDEKPKNPPKVQVEQRRRTDSGLNLATLLREYNNMKEEVIFGTQLFTCEVCFAEKIGSSCIKFQDCGHVYCRDCMKGYFTVQISNAQVNNLTCPFSGCSSQALPNQVRELVPKDLFNKYESILLETTLDAMVDVVVCPRMVCQCPTMIDRETNMGQCPSCQLTFCIYCKATYHGVSPCKFKSKEQRALFLKYSKGTDDEKLFLEKRYGKKQLQQLMALMLSEDYVQDNARCCPHCNAPIEKNEGCNKITCWRCNTHFCWLCTSRLPASNPYSHFNVPGSKCFGTLFQGVDPDDNEWVDDFEDEEDEDGDNLWQMIINDI